MRSRTLQRTFAVVGAGVLGLVGMGATPPPDAPSAGRGSLVVVSAAGVEVLSTGSTLAFWPGSPGPHHSSIDVSALDGTVTVPIDAVHVPIMDGAEEGLLGLGGGAGALNVYAAAPDPDHASAAVGTVGDDGAIDLDGVADPSDTSFARVSLTPLLAQAGVAGLTDAVLDELSLGLGAFGSSASAVSGEAATSDYVLAGAELTISSPAVADLAASLSAELAATSAAINDDLFGPDGAVQTALDSLTVPPIVVGDPAIATVDLGSPEISGSLDLSGAVAPVTGATLASGDGTVQIDLGTGVITVDLAALHGVDGLNDLPPNTPLLTTALIDDIVTAISGVLDSVVTTVADTALAALATTAVTIDFAPTVTARSVTSPPPSTSRSIPPSGPSPARTQGRRLPW